jgi:hypothetical protein
MTDAHPEYPKINGLYKRGEKGAILPDQYARPEFEFLLDVPWLWTEKVDGTNIRLGKDFDRSRTDEASRYIGGRTDRAQIPPDLLAHLQELQDGFPWFDAFHEAADAGAAVTLYGEGYGARIQKGGGNYIPDGVDFVLFDVKVGDFWLTRENVEDVGAKLGIDVVPLVEFNGDRWATIATAESFVKDDRFKSRWPGVERPEGLVGRPHVPLFTNRGDRITTKIKWKDYA